MRTILVVDDETPILESLEMFLGEKGYRVITAATGAEGEMKFRQHHPDVVMLDIRLPDKNGLEILTEMLGIANPPKVIMMTAFQDMETTIEAMKSGAYEYLNKPLDAGEIERTVDRAFRMNWPAGSHEIPADVPSPKGVIIGKSPQMCDIFKTIGILCRNQATVLIQGETGTGKELVARTIHHNSSFSIEPMITLDCSAIVETLLESELFGHSKGAFTGAVETKPGKIELAGRGTLFLDEVTELPISLQSKFLGFLERKEYMRVGGQRIHKSRCRIISATNQDMADLVRQGRFREDLYYRLKVVSIFVPPLRDRICDIPDLARYFLQKAAREHCTEARQFEDGVMDVLCAQPWIGNVRQLQNVIMAAALRSRGKRVLLEDIERELAAGCSRTLANSVDFSLVSSEQAHILKALEHTRWHRSRAADLLGISLPTLRSKIHKYGLQPSKPFHMPMA
ncbi:MAG: sigma-54-dependent Fis family transcriptional regulator [Deltaproteobacteria bacterium]|nr:sigma-54-dependent Fis family transcriptional regulator [Deltaproteobacteria bacterium]